MSSGTSQRMRVLAVAPHEPWPLDHGGRLRLYHFLRWLTRDAEVTLAIPEGPKHRQRLPERLRVESMTASLPGAASGAGPKQPAHWAARLARRHFGYSPAIAGWLDRNARPERFDVALLYGSLLGHHVEDVHVPVVWDLVDDLVLYTVRDAGTRGPRCWPTAARALPFYAIYERYVARRAAVTVFASTVDASYARRWVSPARVEAVSNGVDLTYFRADGQPPEDGPVVFVGALDFPPNTDGIVDFGRGVWPAVYACSARRRLLVVGRRPVQAVQALAALPGIQVVGDVPDVRPYLARAAVVVVPTRGGAGVKNKILEACAMRRPVVASPRALAGLSARPGKEVLCAHDRSTWVQHLSNLLERPGFARTLAEAGHEWVRRAHHWPVLAERLRDILECARLTRRWRGRNAAYRYAAPASHCEQGGHAEGRRCNERQSANDECFDVTSRWWACTAPGTTSPTGKEGACP